MTWHDGTTGTRTGSQLEDLSLRSARDSVLLPDLGYYHETFSCNATASATACVTGALYCVSVGLLAGDVVSKLGIKIVTPGSNLTLCKAALLDKNGNRLCVSVDEKANLTGAGGKFLPMISPYTVTTSGLYYASFLETHSTTGLTLMRGISTSTTDFRMTGATYGSTGGVNGQTDIQPTNTISFGATSMFPLWMAIA